MNEKVLGYDTTIPMAMWFDKNLCPYAVKLYALIRNLANMTGYCFATNKYLCELMGLQERKIKYILAELKKNGYLEIETSKEGIQWQRRIYISDKFKKCLRRATEEQAPIKKMFTKGTAMPPPVHSHAPISNKIEIEKDNPPPPSSPAKEKPPKDSFEKLKRKILSEGYTEEEFNLARERYLSRPPGSVKSIYEWMKTVIDRWRMAVEVGEEDTKNKKEKADRETEVRKFATTLALESPALKRHGYHVFANHTEIKNHDDRWAIFVHNQDGCKEKMIRFLRKLKFVDEKGNLIDHKENHSQTKDHEC